MRLARRPDGGARARACAVVALYAVVTAALESAAPAARRRLVFTLNVSVNEGEEVPLSVHEGDKIETVALKFALQHGLDDNTRDELALAIVQHAKQRGVAPPLFSMPVTLGATNETVASNVTHTLNVYKGDTVWKAASDFAQRFNLSAAAKHQIWRRLALVARGGGHLQPLLLLNVSGAAPAAGALTPPQLSVYEGDDVAQLVAEFGAKHGLGEEGVRRLRAAAMERLKAAHLVPPLLSLPLRLHSAADGDGAAGGGVVLEGAAGAGGAGSEGEDGDGPDEVTVHVYEGDRVEQVALAMAQEHVLGPAQMEALIVLLDAQLTARGVLPPLLFKLAIKLQLSSLSGGAGEPPAPDVGEAAGAAAGGTAEAGSVVAQCVVHVGDDPSALAAAVVARYRDLLGYDDVAVASTSRAIERAIRDRLSVVQEHAAKAKAAKLERR